MDNVEYILRIVLKARDEMAAAFARARKEIESFDKSLDKLDNRMAKVNERITSMNKRVDNVTDKFREWQAVMQGTAADEDKAAKSSDRLAESHGKLGKSVKDVEQDIDALTKSLDEEIEKTERLRQASDDLAGTHTNLQQSYRRGKVTREEYLDQLDRIEKAQKKLAQQSGIGTGDQVRFAGRAREAAQESARIIQIEKDRAKEVEQTRKQAADFAVAQERSRATRQEAIRDAEERRRKAQQDKRVADDAAAAAAHQRNERAREQAARRARAAAVREAKALADLQRHARNAMREFKELNERIEQGRSSSRDTRVEFKALASDLGQVANRLRRDGDSSWKTYADAADYATQRVRAFSDSNRNTNRNVQESGNFFERLADRIASTGDNVATLDNKLRGMIVLGVLVFAQQLNSILVGLGGALVSVAGSAVMAGGALGGALAAGMAQAIPAAGLLIGALARVKAIMDVVQQSDNVLQQQFQRGAQEAKKNADAADTMANAQDSVKSANEGVSDALRGVADANERVVSAQEALAESQMNLTVARREGRREIEDLIRAEQEAIRTARGAVLGQKEAAEALRLAVNRGSSALELESARLALDEAKARRRDSGTDLRRQRVDTRRGVAGGVEGLDSVKQAKKQVEDAREGVDDAIDGVKDAERAVKRAEGSVIRAERAVARAKRNAADITADTFAAAAGLQYMLQQLSPAERKLYEAIQRMRDVYTKNFRAISDIIVNSFTRGVNRATELMGDRRVLSAARGMATGIAKSFNRIQDAFLGDRMIDQFKRISKQGEKNLGPLTDIVIKLGRTFANIAEAAGPAFNKLLEYILELTDRFQDFIQDSFDTGKLEEFFNKGEEHLESWLDLVVSIIRFFAALTGASADEGQKTIEDLTKEIDKATKYIQDNTEKVREFFEEARRVLYEVGRVLKDLGGEMLRSFRVDSVEKFGKFLRDTVIPALGLTIRAVGALVDAFLDFANIPFVSDVMKWGLALLLFSKVVTGTVGLVATMAGQFGHFAAILGSGRGAIKRAANSLANFRGNLGGVSRAQRDALKANKAYDDAMIATGGNTKKANAAASAAVAPTTRLGKAKAGAAKSIRSFGLALRGAAAFMLGPWGLAIAAIVGGVVLFLKHFGFLDNVVRGAKRAFRSFIEPIKEAMGELNKALGGSSKDFDKLNKILKDVARILSDVIIFWMGEVGKAIGKYLGGAIRVIAGIVNIIKGAIGVLSGDPRKVREGWANIKKGIGQAIDGIKGLLEGLFRIITLPFRAAINFIKRLLGISSPSRFFMDVGESIVDGIKAGIKALWDVLTWPFRKAIGFIKDKFEDAKNFVKKGIRGWEIIIKRSDLLSAITKPFRVAVGFIRERFNVIRAVIRRVMGVIKDIIHGRFGDAWNKVKDGVKDALNYVRDRFTGFVDNFKKLPGRIAKASKGLFDGIKDAFKGAINWIIKKWNDLEFGIEGRDLGPLGKFKGVKLGTPDIPELATGGPIGSGYGGGDRRLRLLEDGEHVLTKEEVKAMGGHRAVYALRALFGGGGKSIGVGMQEGGANEREPKKRSARDTEDVSDLLSAILDALRDFGAKALDKFKEIWKDLRVVASRNADQMGKVVSKEMDQMGDRMNNIMRRTQRSMRSRWIDLRQDVTREAKKMVSGVSRSMSSLQDVVYDSMAYIGSAANKALKAYDADPIKFSLEKPRKRGGDDRAKGGIIGRAFAEGGILGSAGERGKDMINAWLGRGEMVLNWAHQKYIEPAVNMYYGHGLTDTFKRVRGRHAGHDGEGLPGMGFAAGTAGSERNRPRNSAVYGPGVMPSKPGFAEIIRYLQKKISPMIYVFSGRRPGDPRNHGTGNAVDITIRGGEGATQGNPMRGKIGSLMDQANSFLGRYIPKPPRRDFLWRTLTGGNHYNHIHIGADDSLVGSVSRARQFMRRWPDAGLGEDVPKRTIRGKGPFSKMGQNIFDKVRAAATKYIEANMPDIVGGGDHGEVTLGPGGPGKKVFDYMVKRRFSENQAAAWVGNLWQESKLSPTVVNPSSGATGLAQWLGGRLVNLKRFGKGSWNTLQTQLDFIWHELMGPERAAYGAIKGARSLADAVRAIAFRYERMGAHEVGDRMSPARDALSRYGDRGDRRAKGGIMGLRGFARGGEIDGSDGEPVPILAHAKEWVLNKVQQSKLAGLLGVTRGNLKALLGFNNKAKESFAEGGEVINYQQAVGRRGIIGMSRRMAIQMEEWEHALVRMTARSLKAVVDRANEAIRKLRRGGTTAAEKNAIKKWEELIGMVAKSSTELPRIMPRGIDALKNLGKRFLKIVTEMHADIPNVHATTKKAQARWGAYFTAVINQLDALTKEGGILAGIEQARQRLVTFRTRVLSSATYAVSSGGRVTRRDGMDEREIASRTLSDTRAGLDDIVGQEGIISNALTKARRALRLARRRGDRKSEEAINAQITNLTEQYEGIRNEHMAAIEAVFQAQIAAQQAAVDQITKQFTTEQGGLDIWRRLATALGNEGAIAQINNATRDMLQRQADALEARIDAARRAGADELADSLVSQVVDLRTQIFESIQAEITETAERINARATRQAGRLDLVERMATAMGRVGLGGTGVTLRDMAGGPDGPLTRTGIFNRRNAIMETQRSDLQALLSRTMSDPMTAGNTAAIENLTDQLVELDVAIRENTKAYFTARIEELNTSVGYNLGIIDLKKQILEAQGVISGNTDNVKLLAFAQERQTELDRQRIGLQELLAEAISNQDEQAIKDLEQAILENELALLQNTQSINELTGATMQPQGFSSSAWSWFREAIFTGMGQVLPQYHVPMGDIGGVAGKSGLYHLQPGEWAVRGADMDKIAEAIRDAGGDTYIINEKPHDFDLTHITSSIAFHKEAKRNAPTPSLIPSQE